METNVMTVRTGHKPLLWGAVVVVAGYAAIAIGGMGVAGLMALGALVVVGGAVTWLVGLVLRVSYNRRSDAPLLFTTGEKVGVCGVILFAIAVALIAGSGEPLLVVQLIGMGGIALSVIGMVWHLLTPRQPSGTK